MEIGNFPAASAKCHDRNVRGRGGTGMTSCQGNSITVAFMTLQPEAWRYVFGDQVVLTLLFPLRSECGH